MTLIHLAALAATLVGLGIAYAGISGHDKRLSFIGVGVALIGALIRASLNLSVTGIGIAIGVYGIGMLLLVYLYKRT